MRVRDLQDFLSKFTAANATGTRQGNAISNAAIFVENDGKLFEIRRMEVHEHSIPILGQPGQSAHRLLMKTQKRSPLIKPTKHKDDY